MYRVYISGDRLLGYLVLYRRTDVGSDFPPHIYANFAPADNMCGGAYLVYDFTIDAVPD